MVANCAELVTEWSSTALVGLALGKQVHSNFKHEELRKLIPLQTPSASANIAAVCQALLNDHREVSEDPASPAGVSGENGEWNSEAFA
jgi:hypothetical protein